MDTPSRESTENEPMGGPGGAWLAHYEVAAARRQERLRRQATQRAERRQRSALMVLAVMSAILIAVIAMLLATGPTELT